MEVVYRCTGKEEADSIALGLSSMSVPYRLEYIGSEWMLLVEHAWRGAALQIINADLKEAGAAEDRVDHAETGQKSLSGVWVAFAVLILHVFLVVSAQWQLAILRFGCSASEVVSGDLFRTVTSLFLHADALHVLGNSVGIAIFGTAVVRETGYGMGWLLILLSGMFGNLANAELYRSHHMSIGASTAVFGAVGILVTLRVLQRPRAPKRAGHILIPVGGGLALLGILGTGGEHTDLLAHLFGFGAGIVVATPYAKTVRKRLARVYQRWLLAFLCIIVAMAWLQLIRT